MFHPRRPLALALSGAAVAASAIALAPAAQADQTLPGGPLAVTVGDLGQLQGRLAGSESGIFYGPRNPLGDAGFFLAFPGATDPAKPQAPQLAGKVFGFQGAAGPRVSFESTGLQSYVARGQDAPTGSGSAADPRTQVTRYAIPDIPAVDEDGTTTYPTPETSPDPSTDDVAITQTTKYVDGTQTFDVSWEVRNQTGQALPFKAMAAADFYFEGSDQGTGIFTAGPPRFIGGTNADTGRSGGFLEVPGPATPWSHYQALAFRDPAGGTNDVWSRVQGSADTTANAFDDTVLGDPEDNAGATEWDQALDEPLAAGASRTFAVTVRTALPAALAFDKTNAGGPQGVPITYLVTARDTAGTAYAGKLLRYTIGGANPGAGAVAIDAAGNAAITDPGTNAGPDTIIAYLDLNGNGVREPAEPQGSALGTFVDNVPPTCAVTVAGDRPTRVGGAGRPLVITVNCDQAATVTTTQRLTLRTKARKATRTRKRVKARTVRITLPAATVAAVPGQPVPLSVTVPTSVTRKYPGLKATASVTVTAVDAAGNAKQLTDTQRVTIAKPAKKKKKRG